MKVFKNPQFKTNRGRPVIVEGGGAMNPLYVIEAALGNVRAPKELGGMAFARKVKALGITLCQLKPDVASIKVEEDELKTLIATLNETAGTFSACFELAAMECLEEAKDVKKKTPIRSRK